MTLRVVTDWCTWYDVRTERTRNAVCVPHCVGPDCDHAGTLHCSTHGYRCVPDEPPCSHMRAVLAYRARMGLE